jgi:hypothetical protein
MADRMTPLLTDDVLSKINAQRISRGFKTIAEVLTLADAGNTLLDPFSILVSKTAKIGRGNTLYPNVIIEATNGGDISVGDGNVFYPGTLLLADAGKILIGDENQLGDGGVCIKAVTTEALIEICNRGRYMNGAQITGQCSLGSGTQILGAISAQNCTLGAGDSFRDPDPETRGGVLKGFGNARNLIVQQGQVINGQGSFEQNRIQQQIVYHPKHT